MIEFFTHLIQTISDNVPLTLAFIFVAAVAEALFLIGALVPSLAIFLTAGGLIGSGELPLLPVLIAAALGAWTGDLLTYWVGAAFEHRIKSIWPFTRYLHILAEGEMFFLRHGPTSILIGRFIPGVKSIVPAIAAMAGMPFFKFALFDLTSGIIWACALILPVAGITFGVESAGLFASHPLLATLIILLLATAIVWGARGLWRRIMRARKLDNTSS